jgi:hypothetical protein
MSYRWAALVLVLALCAMTPKNAAGQTQPQSSRGHSVKVGSKNPFNPDIHITILVPDSTTVNNRCVGDNGKHVVSARILNIFGQAVVVPQLFARGGDFTAIDQSLRGAAITNLSLSCGTYDAYWNGHQRNDLSRPESASGTYLVVVSIDGKQQDPVRIMFLK